MKIGHQKSPATPYQRKLCLDLWSRNAPTPEIARRCGFDTDQAVYNLIAYCRKQGDPRAKPRGQVADRYIVEPLDRKRYPLRCPELGIEAVSRTITNTIPLLQQAQPVVTISVPRVRFLEGRT